MKPITAESHTPYGIEFTVNAEFPTIAEGILNVEKDSIDSCNLLALAHEKHSSHSSIVIVSLQYLTINFRSEDNCKDFSLKLECAQGKWHAKVLSNEITLRKAKKTPSKYRRSNPHGTCPFVMDYKMPLRLPTGIRSDRAGLDALWSGQFRRLGDRYRYADLKSIQ
jgi:hypothetical protein